MKFDLLRTCFFHETLLATFLELGISLIPRLRGGAWICNNTSLAKVNIYILLVIAPQSLYIATFSLKCAACGDAIIFYRNSSVSDKFSLLGDQCHCCTSYSSVACLYTSNIWDLLPACWSPHCSNPVCAADPTRNKGEVSQCKSVMVMNWTVSNLQGETLERIELLFSKPWLERINLAYYLR